MYFQELVDRLWDDALLRVFDWSDDFARFPLDYRCWTRDDDNYTDIDEDLLVPLDAGVDAIIGPASSNVALSQLGAAVDPNAGVVVCSPTATAWSRSWPCQG